VIDDALRAARARLPGQNAGFISTVAHFLLELSKHAWLERELAQIEADALA
jgi:hypothetical protein